MQMRERESDVCSNARISTRLLTVGNPPYAHLAKIEITLTFPSQLIYIMSTDPAFNSQMQLEVGLSALAPSEEKFDAVALPTGILLLFVSHLFGPLALVLLL
jgi:hypothetical protein